MIGFPKPQRDERLKGKRREKRIERKHTTTIRQYVFARERDMCRCCRLRRAESMHEMIPRGRGGKRSKKNSIAVCGDGVQGCHGYLQRYEIKAHGDNLLDGLIPNAEATLWFTIHTAKAKDYLRFDARADAIVSPPMHQTEISE